MEDPRWLLVFFLQMVDLWVELPRLFLGAGVQHSSELGKMVPASLISCGTSFSYMQAHVQQRMPLQMQVRTNAFNRIYMCLYLCPLWNRCKARIELLFFSILVSYERYGEIIHAHTSNLDFQLMQVSRWEGR